MSTAAPPTAPHNSDELLRDVCSDGIKRVNEWVEIYHDGKQVLMIGVLIYNRFYRNKIGDQIDNRISADQSAS